MTARLRAEIWAGAYLRRRNADGAAAVVVRRGDPDAGAIFVKVYQGSGAARLFAPAVSPEGERGFRDVMRGSAPEPDVDARIAREAGFDPDIWVIEVEDASGDPAFVEPVFPN